MKCINATSLHRQSGPWGTQHLLPVGRRNRRFSTAKIGFSGLIPHEMITAQES